MLSERAKTKENPGKTSNHPGINGILDPAFHNKSELNELNRRLTNEIRKRKKIEEKLKKLRLERQYFLHEIHDRVKNNMQLISSLLKLQLNHIENINVKSILNECLGRIYTMAEIHDDIYKNEDFTEINMPSYIRDLVTRNLIIHGRKKLLIDFEYQMDAVDLNIISALPLGLMINELVANAVRHAFKNRKNGTIRLILKKINNNIIFIIEDNGSGLPPEIKIEEPASLGLFLIFNLANQLNGKVEAENKKGARFKFQFPLK